MQDLARAARGFLNSILENDYRNAFVNLIARLEKCVEFGGEYFEGMQTFMELWTLLRNSLMSDLFD